MLEVTIRDGSFRVVRGHQTGGDLVWERLAPEEGVSIGVEVDASHSHLGRVRGSQEGRFLGHDLGEMRGPVAEASG